MKLQRENPKSLPRAKCLAPSISQEKEGISLAWPNATGISLLRSNCVRFFDEHIWWTEQNSNDEVALRILDKYIQFQQVTLNSACKKGYVWRWRQLNCFNTGVQEEYIYVSMIVLSASFWLLKVWKWVRSSTFRHTLMGMGVGAIRPKVTLQKSPETRILTVVALLKDYNSLLRVWIKTCFWAL